VPRSFNFQAFTFIPFIAKFPAEPEKRAFLEAFAERAPELIETHHIKGNPAEVTKGFEAMPVAWDKLRVGGVCSPLKGSKDANIPSKRKCRGRSW
jgi:hypothetical protein